MSYHTSFIAPQHFSRGDKAARLHRRGNVAGLWTSRNLNTPEGLEGRLSIRIHIILAELPHSTELEHGKLHRA
jgi:hypothetical protein